jgi:HEXXH motif-containing protein
MDNPAILRFDRWLLPLSDAVEVSAINDTVSINARTAVGWRKTIFHRDENSWDAKNGAEALPALSRCGIRWILLRPEALSPESPARLLATGSYDFEAPPTEVQKQYMLRTCEAALDLLAEFADVYVAWVTQVIRDLIPLPARPDMINSASGNFAPGVITASNEKLRCVLAEMLVHEATHQYLYILKRLGPIDDGTDETLYFSPFRNMGRPILYILFAYHAFGNVLLFYRMVRERSQDEPGVYNDQRFEELERKLRTLEVALQTTTALTPLGRALWEPLYTRIHG